MKKIITLFVLVFNLTAGAQIINPGFETWSADVLAPTANNPNSGNNSTGWWTYNMFHNPSIGSSPISVFRCDTFHGGSYSARIKTVIYTAASYSLCAPWGVPFIGHNYLDTLGILFNGNTSELTGIYKPGIPFTQKINQFSFWYQYFPNGVDTAECRIMLVNNRNPVAGGLVKLPVATGSTWQQATITMTYVSSLTPDTLYVLFSSSSLDKKPKPGSTFLVDDLSVTILSGIEQVTDNTGQIKVYPNPSNNNVIIESDVAKLGIVNIYNSLGEIVVQIKSGNTREQIDVSKLPAGIYMIQAQNKYLKLIKE